MTISQLILTLVLSLGIPAFVYFAVPYIVTARTSAYRGVLVLACVLFAVSWYLPSPLVHGAQTHFMTHFVGGGLFTAALVAYVLLVKKQAARYKWYYEAAALFALVSTLGVANELFEVVLYWAGLMPAGIADTSWDLVANTLGAATGFIIYKVARVVCSR